MPLVKKRSNIQFCPRDMIPYFRENKDIWYKLNAGQEVMIPANEVKNIGKFIVVAKEASKADATANVSGKKSGFLSHTLKSVTTGEKKGTN